MTSLLQDLRHTLLSLKRMPLLTVAALACIAIGVGASVSVFALINATLLRGLPYPDSDRLVRVWATHGEDLRRDLSYLNFEDLRGRVGSLSALEGVARTRLAVVYERTTERTRGEGVSPGYFQLIGLEPIKGRLFTESEYARNAPNLVLISHNLWTNRFGSDPNVVGKTLVARGAWSGQDASNRPYEIIGVMPEGFVGTIEEDVSDFWLPMVKYEPTANLDSRSQRIIWTIGKLAEGSSLRTAEQEVSALGRALESEYPEENEGVGARIEPMGENWRGELRRGLVLLLVASLLLLLIACTNIANLLLARMARRQHEMTMRMVLGAGRGRLVRQMLTESITLSALGGALGLALAWGFVRVCIAVAGEDIPSYVQVGLDWRVVLAAFGVILLTGIAAGLLPALLGTRLNPGEELKETGRSASLGRRQRRFGHVLVAVEVALTVVLVIAASLMLRSYLNLKTEDLGFRTADLLRLTVSVDRSAFPEPDDWVELGRQAKEAVEAYPGVAQASVMGGILPPYADVSVDMVLESAGGRIQSGIGRHTIDADFLEVMDIELLAGRNVRRTDDGDSPRVVLVSESLARLVSGADARAAVGRRVRFARGGDPENLSDPYEVIGVVSDLAYEGPLAEQAQPYELFMSLWQVPDWLLSFAVHTQVDPESLAEPLTQVIGEISNPSPVHWVSTMEYELGRQYSDSRFYALLIAFYSLSAVLLAIIGIYGVLANSVSRRVSELGVRMAIGAQAGDVLRLVLAQSMRVVVLGLAAGLVAAFLATRVMGSLLYGVGTTDVVTFLAVTVGLLLLCLLASFLPARRATQVDPVKALRGS